MERLEIGNKVKLNLPKIQEITLDELMLKEIRQFDEEYKGIHTITDVFVKNPYTSNTIYRYELDNDFVFYYNELIKIN